MSNKKQVGIWLIGAYGNISSLCFLFSILLKKKLSTTPNLITQQPEFSKLGLIEPENFIFAGHDVRFTSLKDSLTQFSKSSGVIDSHILNEVQSEISEIENNIRPGYTFSKISNTQQKIIPQKVNLKDVVFRLKEDIENFKTKFNLSTVIAINLSSAEQPPQKTFVQIDEFEKNISKNRKDLILPSGVYAYAVLSLGLPFINFTSSKFCTSDVFVNLAKKNRTCIMGDDGKTGETFIKSVLAPAFHLKNLKILSWQSYNILGNTDGANLSDPEKSKMKITNKRDILMKILKRDDFHSDVRIDYVPSLGDWKTAWDFIHFEGFLNTKMSLQFIWHGCDSILAVPMIFDIIRLTEYSLRKKHTGAMPHLSIFFKNPLQTETHDFFSQYKILKDWVSNS